MRATLASFASLLVLTACSSAGNGGGLPPASTPAPYLLQYAGDYADASGAIGFSHLVLHADGTLQVTLTGGGTLGGVYSGSGRPGDASATAQTQDGRTFGLSFTSTTATDVPTQVVASFGGGSLVSLWAAGSESMCDATGGTWRDDDPDPKTGLYCTCVVRDVYVPSRGGCVEASSRGGDPDRRAPSDSAQDRAAGSYEGTGTITSLHVSRDGSYDATIDGRHDEGTWWEAPSLTGSGTSIDFTGAARAFHAVFADDGAVTLQLGSGKTESLRAQR